MPTVKRIRFSAEVLAPVARVFQPVIEPGSCKHWTSAFAEGTWFKDPGSISSGVEDSTSESVRASAPGRENSTLLAAHAGTRLVIDQDVADEPAFRTVA